MRVEVVGPMLCAKHAVRAMSTAHAGQGGCIVSIASGAAKAPAGLTGMVPYEATKGAVVSFSSGAGGPNDVLSAKPAANAPV